MKMSFITNKTKILFAFLLLAFSQAAYAQGYIGLIGRWPFSSSAADVSGNGLNGIVVGATLTAGSTGIPNTAYNFNGTNDYIKIPYNSLMNSMLHSICVKVKIHDWYPGLCQGNSIVWRGDEGRADFSYHLKTCDNPWDNSCYVYSNTHQVFMGRTGNPTATAPLSTWYYVPPVDTGIWYCVVSTYDGDTTRIYVDGVLKSRFYEHCIFTPSTDSMNFGKSGDNPPYLYWLNGTIDEVRLYNRVLSQAEVNMFCDSLSLPAVGACNTLSLPDTIHACPDASVILPATVTGSSSLISVLWTPTTGLSDSTLLAPTLNVGTTSSIRHITVNSLLPGSADLVVNGDFSVGNTGFSSGYSYVSGPTSLYPAGVYAISTDPHNEHPGAYSFLDHTSGSGNMIAINGASSPFNVWCQTITVSPNTYYDFSAWFSNWSSDTVTGLPQIVFQINGSPLSAAPFTFVPTPGLWSQYNSAWYSGAATSATICISDLSTASSGNDFAIDDISFHQMCSATDSIYVAVATSNSILRSTSTTLCLPGTTTLSGPVSHSNYHWNSGSAVSSISISGGGTYWVMSDSSCTSFTDTFHVHGLVNPTVTLGNDTVLCAGNSLHLSSIQPAGSTFLWSTGSISDSTTITTAGTFWLFVSDSGCIATDTIHVAINALPIVNIGPDIVVCNSTPTTLFSSGTYTGPAYLWSTGATGSIIAVSSSGNYWLRVIQNGCSASDTVHVAYRIPIVVSLGNDAAFCVGGTLHLSSIQPLGSTYLWSTGALGNNLNITATGTYWLAVSDSGCTASDTIHVLVSPHPIVNLGPDTSGCIGSPIILQSFGSYTTPQYLWSTGAITPAVSITTAGTYWLQITDAGCSGRDSVTLDLFTPLTVDLGPDTTLCNIADFVLFSAQPAGTQYLWNTGSTADSIPVSTTGVYWLQVNNGCRVADTISIRVDQIPFADILVSENVCIGDTITLAIANHSANASDYTWNFGGANIITHNSNHGGPFTASWSTTGIYIITLTAYSQLGCVGLPFSDTINVHNKPDAVIAASDISRLNCLSDSVLLTAQNSTPENLYQWTPAHFFNVATGSEVWGLIENSGYVSLTVTNAFGCTATDSMLFNPDACCTLEFPTAFTPNGDGKNDVFRPIKHGYQNFRNFRIYNRFGQVVYVSSDNNIAWDGTFNGEPQDLGVFYYYAKYDCDGKTLVQKGDVTLVR